MLNSAFKIRQKIISNTLYLDKCDIYYPPSEYRDYLRIKYKDVPCKIDTITPDYDGQTETVNIDFSTHHIDLSLDYDVNKGDIFVTNKYPNLELRASMPVRGYYHQEIFLTNRSYN